MTVNIEDFINPISSKSVNLEVIASFNVDQVEKLWNSLQIKGLKSQEESSDRLIKNKCLEVLEKLYRKPWDETIFFKIIQMRLDQLRDDKSHLVQIKRLFSELVVTCPLLPKNQTKRLLELKGAFHIQKMRDCLGLGSGSGCQEEMMSQLISEQVEIFVECKRKGLSINNQIGPKVLELFRTVPSTTTKSLQFGKEFESLLPECEEFREFHVDLLNILTENTLNCAIECRRNMKQFSEMITDAINWNVRSLALRPNVMGYFEFLKLTRLQCGNTVGNSSDFDQAIETCLLTLKNRVNPNENIRGKLQIIRLIVAETGKLEKGIEFACELFANCDFNNCGCFIMEDLLCIIDENSSNNSSSSPIIKLLERFSDQVRESKQSQTCIIETLLRLTEKNFTVKGDFQRAEEIFKVIKNLNSDSDSTSLRLKMIKCCLRLDKLSEAESELDLMAGDSLQLLLLKLEAALRSQNEFDSLSFIEKILENSEGRSEHFLGLFNLLKTRLPAELQMKLLQAAKSSDDKSGMIIDIERGIIGLLYDGILESGLTEEYKTELDNCLHSIKDSDLLSKEQRLWCCQVCWNLGVIHARAEDFNNAQFCFKWCHDFSSTTLKTFAFSKEFLFKSAFYYLTTKMCCPAVEIVENDFLILDGLESDSESMETEVICLKIEMLLKTEKWTALEEMLKTATTLSYETIAEIVLRTSADIPMAIYHLILSTLTEREFDSSNFDLIKFSKLFRGMITCSLLQYPSDLAHFQSALKVIKSSFGAYPGDEITWLCGTSLEMGRQAVNVMGDWNKGAEWTEMAMNLVYLIPESDSADKFIKNTLKESIQELFEKIVNRL